MNKLDFKFLSILGDGESHPYHEVIFLAHQLTGMSKELINQQLRRMAVDNSWITRTFKINNVEWDNLLLTEKGDRYLRDMLIWMETDPNMKAYYAGYDRTVKGYEKYFPWKQSDVRANSSGMTEEEKKEYIQKYLRDK